MSATSPERGFAAIVAVFILVVLGGLGAVLVTISGTQQRGQAFDALGIQAYHSARAGIDFGIYQALRNGSCTTTSFALPGSLARFSVNVACTSTTHTEAVAGNTVVVYEIAATACNRAACPGTADGTYVERQLRVTVGSSAP